MGIGFTQYPKMQASARKTQCMNNLKQLFIAFTAYMHDNDDNLPVVVDDTKDKYKEQWPVALYEEGTKDPGMYICPVDDSAKTIRENFDKIKDVLKDKKTEETKPKRFSSYVINAKIASANINDIDEPHQYPLLFDAASDFNPGEDDKANQVDEKLSVDEYYPVISDRHSKKCLCLMISGNVNLYEKKELAPLLLK